MAFTGTTSVHLRQHVGAASRGSAGAGRDILYWYVEGVHLMDHIYIPQDTVQEVHGRGVAGTLWKHY